MGQQTRGRRLNSADREALGTSRGETTREARERRSRARERDEPYERAYNAGKAGEDPAEFQTDDRLWATYQDGQNDAKQEHRAERGEARRAQRGEQAAAAGARLGSAADQGAGFLLGLFAYALVINFLRNGAAGSRGWLAAKFLNRPMASSGAAVAAAGSKASTAGGVMGRVG